MAAFMTRSRLCILTMISALPLAACAIQKEYPSLAIRDAERITGVAEPVAAQKPDSAPPRPVQASPVQAGANAQLTDSLARLVERAEAAHAAFAGKQDNVQKMVTAGGGAPVGSEGWAVANVALSDLEASRSETMIALAGLDHLYAEERLAHYEEETADAKAIAASRDRIAGWIDAENAVLSDLRARMGD